MTASTNTNRYSTHTTASGSSDSKNGSANSESNEIWLPLLKETAEAKKLEEKKKNIIVLGGTVDSQREFVESLSNNELRRTLNRYGSRGVPPIANSFALGYTYYDLLDQQEETLARISLYTLTSPSSAFASLLQPLLTPESIPDTLIVILLDWSQPWKWMRQLREWILLLRTVILSLSHEARATMEEIMMEWRDRGREGGKNLDGTNSHTAAEGDVSLPVGPGEWADALGLPLCLVCQNAEKMEYLEKTQGWKEEEFDAVLQFLRTVLLRHGASLIYTTPSAPSQLPTLIHASLGISSPLKKVSLKYNVIDRDKIVVPPNWDSWGKIRVLREGFDVEDVSNGWSIDLNHYQRPPTPGRKHHLDGEANGHTNGNGGIHPGEDEDEEGHEEEIVEEEPEGSAVVMYEEVVRDPTMDALHIAGQNNHSTKLEVKTEETQSFLGQQLKILEKQKHEELSREEAARQKSVKRIENNHDDDPFASLVAGRQNDAKVLEHIGPVQFNMGGIQVDADDMVQRLKDRQASDYSLDPPSPDGEGDVEESPQMDTENLQKFFTGLMNRRGGSAK